MEKTINKYLLKQPVPLVKLTLAKVGDWVAMQAEMLMKPLANIHQQDPAKAEELLTERIQLIRYCLECYVPPTLHDELFSEAVRALLHLCSNLHGTEMYLRLYRNRIFLDDIGRRMIEVLMTKYLTFLTFDAWEWFQDSFYSNADMLTGLVHLRLNGDMVEDNIILMLKELRGLKYLTLNNICTHNILQCIIDNCTLIEKLDLSHTDLSDDCIDLLVQLPNLRSLDLGDTSISELGVETLLLSCEKLEHIATNSWQNNAHVLDRIVFGLKHLEKHFKLKDYENDDDTTPEQIRVVTKMCPQLRKVNLAKFRSSQSYVMLLKNMPDLQELELMGYDFYEDEVKEFLEESGSKLIHLHLEDVISLDRNALVCICQSCPNLESLIIEQCIYVDEYHQIKTDDDEEPEEYVPPLKCLKRLTLKGEESDPSYDQLFLILSSIPSIEVLYCGFDLKDEFMLSVLDINPFSCLKSLKIVQDEMSFLVIERLVENSKHHLEVMASC